MYGYQGQQYGAPPAWGTYPQAAPGMGPPPGMAAPGTGPPPGMDMGDMQQQQQASRPVGLPPNFQSPHNMPNINFNAPVIRLGTTGPGAEGGMMNGTSGRPMPDQRNNHRAGLGMDMHSQRQPPRDNVPLVAPSKDEIARTIFVGGITEGVRGDVGVERILRSVGSLRRWIRASDSENKQCSFGFAEFENAESLSTAVEALKNVEVPVQKQNIVSDVQVDKDKDAVTVKDEDDTADSERSKLLVMIDDGTYDYLANWEASRGDTDPIQAQLRLDAAKSQLAAVLASLFKPTTTNLGNEQTNGTGPDGRPFGANGDMDPNAEVITIPLTADDELAEVPAELREQVAKEIHAFRDRSVRRDLERLKREEELEAMERKRSGVNVRVSRMASPPASAASASNAKSTASGGNSSSLRDRNVPLGPKGYNDSGPVANKSGQNVSFQHGTGLNGAGGGGLYAADQAWEDSDASDNELEKRRQDRMHEEQEMQYQDQKRRWLNRERSRTAAVEREKARDNDDDGRIQAAREDMGRRLKEYNDEEEADRRHDAYFADRSQWIRTRAVFRAREAALDDEDRAAEERENARADRQRDQDRGLADDFLNRQADDLLPRHTNGQGSMPAHSQPFKLSLGAAAAAQKAAQQAANSSKRRTTAAEVEGLLEDEEEADSGGKRTLVPIAFDSNEIDGASLTPEERQQAARELAADIPVDTAGLWKWPVRWEFVDEAVVTEQLRPFVEKKIVEYLGVQEQMLVDVVENFVRKKGSPADLVGELEGALDEEAENLVKKLWRMIIFLSESQKRGLSG